jgi:glycosyltransferase involved in cell wall biosynthesis
MTITVVTACHNAEAYIESALASVITQHCPDLEYIVIDGASQDATFSIVGDYESGEFSSWSLGFRLDLDED